MVVYLSLKFLYVIRGDRPVLDDATLEASLGSLLQLLCVSAEVFHLLAPPFCLQHLPQLPLPLPHGLQVGTLVFQFQSDGLHLCLNVLESEMEILFHISADPRARATSASCMLSSEGSPAWRSWYLDCCSSVMRSTL
ncbi:hypothetical protein EYF80_021290 [Liparis tanakae]|uniref:Uncharacterized protein n=1 Tax=Liparis tanakae TaxID=230148 RepID=A0A4Z2HT72_9TELE|nr:hypothetical protein EYF80_021290 [Liparis tanakae]